MSGVNFSVVPDENDFVDDDENAPGSSSSARGPTHRGRPPMQSGVSRNRSWGRASSVDSASRGGGADDIPGSVRFGEMDEGGDKDPDEQNGDKDDNFDEEDAFDADATAPRGLRFAPLPEKQKRFSLIPVGMVPRGSVAAPATGYDKNKRIEAKSFMITGEDAEKLQEELQRMTFALDQEESRYGKAMSAIKIFRMQTFMFMNDPTFCIYAKYFKDFLLILDITAIIWSLVTLQHNEYSCPPSENAECPKSFAAEVFNIQTDRVDIPCSLVANVAETDWYLGETCVVGGQNGCACGFERGYTFNSDIIFDIVFVLELLVRLWSVPRRRSFLSNSYNFINMLVVIPFFAGQFEVFEPRFAFVWFLKPIFRFVKLFRYLPQSTLLRISLMDSFSPLLTAGFFLVVVVTFFSGILFFLETFDDIYPAHISTGIAENNPATYRVTSFPATFVYVFTCVITVDVGPHFQVEAKSRLGQYLTVVLCVLGVIFMALPLTIIGTHFNATWQDKDRILLVEEKIDEQNFRVHCKMP